MGLQHLRGRPARARAGGGGVLGLCAGAARVSPAGFLRSVQRRPVLDTGGGEQLHRVCSGFAFTGCVVHRLPELRGRTRADFDPKRLRGMRTGETRQRAGDWLPVLRSMAICKRVTVGTV